MLAKAVNASNVRDIIRKSSEAGRSPRSTPTPGIAAAAAAAAAVNLLVPGQTTRTERRRRSTSIAREQCKKRWRLLRNVRCLMTRGHREVQYGVQQGQAVVEDSKTRVRRRKSVVRGRGHMHTPDRRLLEVLRVAVRVPDSEHYARGEWVWMPHKEEGYVAAKVLSRDDGGGGTKNKGGSVSLTYIEGEDKGARGARMRHSSIAEDDEDEDDDDDDVPEDSYPSHGRGSDVVPAHGGTQKNATLKGARAGAMALAVLYPSTVRRIYSNLVNMEEFSEGAILNQIAMRFARDVIYTYVVNCRDSSYTFFFLRLCDRSF